MELIAPTLGDRNQLRNSKCMHWRWESDVKPGDGNLVKVMVNALKDGN